MDVKELEASIAGIETIKTEVKALKDGSVQKEEKLQEMERALNGLDDLKEKFEKMETASKRLNAAEEAKEEVAKEVMEHKNAFNDYLLNANEVGLRDMERKTLSVGSDPDGGYVASDELSSRILSTIYETSPMRNIAFVQSTSKKELTFLVDKDEAGAVWTAEQGVNSDTTTPQFGELKILAHKMSTEPAITTEMLQDSDIDIESWLQAKVSDKFARTENAAFVNGTGVGQPRGFTTYANGTAWGQIEQTETAATGKVDEIDLISLMDSLKDGYREGASWLMSRRTNTVLRKLQDANGLFLFTGQDLMDGTLFGSKITRMEDMDKPASPAVTFTAGTLPIAYGNFNTGYTVLDRLALNVLRDPFTSKGYVKYYTTRRVGGDITNFEAIKLLSVKA